MKILNNKYRDIAGGENTIIKTPITELLSTYNLAEGSFIHVVEHDGQGHYESKKITVDDFKQKIYDSVQNTLKTSYWDTHELKKDKTPSDKHDQGEDPNGDRPEGTSFKDLLEYLKSKDTTRANDEETTPIYAPEEVSETDPNGFVDHLYFDFDLIKRYMVVKDGDIENSIQRLDERVDALDCYFAPAMKFSTTKLNNNNEIEPTGSSVNHNLTENDNYCQMYIESGNKISNEWTCPATGNLVIYGWLDSSACLNNKSTPSAFCVIEGNINNNWEIISVAPVNPAKTLTYVGFNIMVKTGLTIRARTGFICGSKSGQFANQQDGYDTLSNSRVNGFKCMIYRSNEVSDTMTSEDYE